MARNLNDLADDLDKLALSLGDRANSLSKHVALTIVGDLAYKTPVDTSQALSNWQVTIGAPAPGTVKAHFPGVLGSTQRASAAATIDAAKSALANKKPGQTIWITNNLPYIRRLNDGSSKQQPAGFVERAELLGRRLTQTPRRK